MPKLIFDNRTHPSALLPRGGSNFTAGISSSGKLAPGGNAKTRDSLTTKTVDSNKDALKLPCVICHAFSEVVSVEVHKEKHF